MFDLNLLVDGYTCRHLLSSRLTRLHNDDGKDGYNADRNACANDRADDLLSLTVFSHVSSNREQQITCRRG